MHSCGNSGLVAAAALLIAVALLRPEPLAAATHERGRLAVSLGGSAAYSQNHEVRSQGAREVVFDDYTVTLDPTYDEDDYTDVDLSLFCSSGYFFFDRIEIGLVGSTLLTQYTSTDRENFSLYDAKLYGKYYFDNASRVTPFVKLQGGRSWMRSGDYEEANEVAGIVGGLEYYGLGPWSYFVELSSEYTNLGGDREGYEWRNQVYLGVSLYLDLRRRAREAAAAPAMSAAPAAELAPAVRRWIRKQDAQWEDALERIDRRTDEAP